MDPARISVQACHCCRAQRAAQHGPAGPVAPKTAFACLPWAACGSAWKQQQARRALRCWRVQTETLWRAAPGSPARRAALREQGWPTAARSSPRPLAALQLPASSARLAGRGRPGPATAVAACKQRRLLRAARAPQSIQGGGADSTQPQQARRPRLLQLLQRLRRQQQLLRQLLLMLKRPELLQRPVRQATAATRGGGRRTAAHARDHAGRRARRPCVASGPGPS